MDPNANIYRLNQNNIEYILSVKLQEPQIIISCNKITQPSEVHTRVFTVESLKNLDQIFNVIQTPMEAVQWIDNALNVHKVGIKEDNFSFKIIFYINTNGVSHKVVIPMDQKNNYETNINSNYTAIKEGPTTISSDLNEAKYITEIGLDPTKIVKQIVNYNTAQIIKSIEEEQQLHMSQIKDVTDNNYDASNINININANEYQTDLSNVEATSELNKYDYNSSTQYEQNNVYLNQDQTGNLQYNTVQYEDENNYEGIQPTETPITEETKEQINNTFDANYVTNAPLLEENIVNNVNEYTPSTYDNNYGQTTNYYNTNETFEQNNYEQYQGTTQLDTQNIISDYNNANILKTNYQNMHGSLLGQLEDDTYSLKNENQEIQYKLNNLSGQVQAYQNQLEYMEKQKVSNEMLALKAQNEAMKQQINQLTNMRNEASEVQNLRNQMSILSPLRRKVGEIDAIKGQLNELPYLRAKLNELSGLKTQIGDINNLKAQVGQMNIIQQQMNEINVLKAKVDQLNKTQMSQMQINNKDNEKEILRKQLAELKNLNNKYQQEIKELKESQIIVQEKKFEQIKIKDDEQENKEEKENKDEEHKEEINKSEEKKESEEDSNIDKKEVLFGEKISKDIIKGDIIHSKKELELISSKINKNNKKITLNLLYKATVDSDKAKVFHEKCDKAKSTLVLIETDKGKRFGGYTKCSWKGNGVDKMDEDAFVFSLNKMMIYENLPQEEAIGCYPKFGPVFLGCQIRIYDNAFKNGGTTFEKGMNYNTEEDYELSGGDRIYNVKEIEVYEVIIE